MAYKISQSHYLANSLTLFRAFVAIPLIVCLQCRVFSVAWLIIVIGGLSDIADGALARHGGGGTKWGAKFDPLADKILLSAPMLWLVSNSVLPFWAVWILLTRDFVVSIWRFNDLEGGPASLSGKIKTVLQFLVILLLIWPPSWGGLFLSLKFNEIGFALFWISLIISLWSGLEYFRNQLISYRQ